MAIGAELLASGGYELIDWEADWAGNSTSIIVGIIVALAVTAVAAGLIRSRAGRKASAEYRNF